jgi:hypothetical protein
MTSSVPPSGTKKAVDIQVLRCLDDACRALLPFEVTAQRDLYVDLAWMAERDGELRFFPCPRCGGRNIVEEVVDPKGLRRHRVTRFERSPGQAAR